MQSYCQTVQIAPVTGTKVLPQPVLVSEVHGWWSVTLPKIHLPLTPTVGCSHLRSPTQGSAWPPLLLAAPVKPFQVLLHLRGEFQLLVLCLGLGRISTEDSEWSCAWFTGSPAKGVSHRSHHRPPYTKQTLIQHNFYSSKPWVPEVPSLCKYPKDISCEATCRLKIY